MTVEKIIELKKIEAEIKELEKLAEAIKNEMKEEMGGKELEEVGGFKVHYTVVIGSRLNSKELKKEMPSIYEKFVEETITRRFSIS